MTIIKRGPVRPDSLRGHYAGFVTRYIAFLLDALLIAAGSFLLIVILRTTFTFFGIDQLLAEIRNALGLDQTSQVVTGTMRWLGTLFWSFLVFGVYSIISWLLVGKTVGKALMGLRVLGDDGKRITFRQALKRSIGYYLSALPLFLGFLWVLVDDRRQSWHDKLSSTLVVYEWDAQHEESFVNAVAQFRESRRQRALAREREQREALERRQGGGFES
jgi:uncharacterized RDD family membrane protein YckC